MVCLETEARENLQIKEKFGHCLSYILPSTGNPVVHWPSYSKLYQQLCEGITLNNGTKASVTLFLIFFTVLYSWTYNGVKRRMFGNGFEF